MRFAAIHKSGWPPHRTQAMLQEVDFKTTRRSTAYRARQSATISPKEIVRGVHVVASLPESRTNQCIPRPDAHLFGSETSSALACSVGCKVVEKLKQGSHSYPESMAAPLAERAQWQTKAAPRAVQHTTVHPCEPRRVRSSFATRYI